MILLLVIGLFLGLAGYVVSTLESTYSAEKTVSKIYAKQQGYHALVSLVPYIKDALRREDQKVDSLMDPWAFPFEVETERGSLRVEIRDEDRFVDLRKAVRDPKLERVLRRVFRDLGIDPSKVDLIKNWSRTREIRSVYDLLRMGFTEEEVSKVLEAVTVYSSGKINVNTAPKVVLKALDEDMDDIVVERITERRARRPFEKVEDLVLIEGITFDTLYRMKDLVDVRSAVFRVQATVRVGDVETTLDLVYDRRSGKILYKRIY